MSFMCGVCGDTDFYLQYKGSAVGMYCANCGKWSKWVGKKDLPMLQRQGKQIYPQGVMVTLKGGAPNTQIPQSSSFEQIPVVRPATFSKQVPSGNFGVAYEPSWVKEVNSQVNLSVEEELPFAKEEINSTNTLKNTRPCHFCEGAPFESVTPSNLDLMLFDGMLTVSDKEGSTIYGSYRLNFCPFCGREVAVK